MDVSRGRRRSGDELWQQVQIPMAVLPSYLTSARLQINDLFLRLPPSSTQIPSVGVNSSDRLFYPAPSRSITIPRVCRMYPGLPPADRAHTRVWRDDFNADRTESGCQKR